MLVPRLGLSSFDEGVGARQVNQTGSGKAPSMNNVRIAGVQTGHKSL